MSGKFILFGVVVALSVSCDSGPQEIKSVSSGSSGTASSSPEFSALKEASQSVLHQVEAKETFDAERYTYVRVAEGDEEYWVAITKQPVEVGKQYVFQRGLMKKNFFSPEFNRVFETLYLVSDFRPAGGGANPAEDVLSSLQSGDVLKVDPQQISRPEGSVPLSELFGNMADYNGKQVVVTGKVVKVNPMIMGRNWIHIQDGTVEGKDLTVTTMENIPLGHVVSFEGTIALNKDFGAGYRYDIILEGAVVKK